MRHPQRKRNSAVWWCCHKDYFLYTIFRGSGYENHLLGRFILPLTLSYYNILFKRRCVISNKHLFQFHIQVQRAAKRQNKWVKDYKYKHYGAAFCSRHFALVNCQLLREQAYSKNYNQLLVTGFHCRFLFCTAAL